MWGIITFTNFSLHPFYIILSFYSSNIQSIPFHPTLWNEIHDYHNKEQHHQANLQHQNKWYHDQIQNIINISFIFKPIQRYCHNHQLSYEFFYQDILFLFIRLGVARSSSYYIQYNKCYCCAVEKNKITKQINKIANNNDVC